MTAPAFNAVTTSGRIPAETIRLVRVFHQLTRDELADCFGISVRTIFRWEKDGVDPASLQLDPQAKSGPDWRRRYLLWLFERYEATGVSDSRKKEG